MRNWLQAIVIGTAAAVASLPAQAETLADALISAYRSSHLIDQNQAVLRASDEDVAIAVAALRPVVAFVGNWNNTWANANPKNRPHVSTTDTLGLSVALSAEMTLFDFGRNRLAIDMAEQSVLATRQALVNVEQQVLLAAVDAFVNVRLNQEIVGLRQSNVRLIGQELRAAQDRFEVGEITRTDVAIAEAELAAARAALATAEGNLMIARESYKAAVGHYPGNLSALPKAPAIPKSLDEARDVAIKTHPLIRQSQHLVTVSDRAVALTEANMKPSIGIGASLSHSYTDSEGFLNDGTKNNAQLGLSFNQTLYAGGRLSALFRKAVAQKEAQRAALRGTVVGVEQNIGNAWARFAVFIASIEATNRQITAAQEAFDGVREEANLGARTTLDVLDAEQDLLDARTARLQADAGRYVAVYQILSSMGLLTVDHLQLGIPTYDPKAYYNAVRNAPATSSRGRKLDDIMKKIAN